jgi:hypothetical protein
VGFLARWVFSRRGEGGVWRSGGSVTAMWSEEEAMGSDAWHVAKWRRERGGLVSEHGMWCGGERGVRAAAGPGRGEAGSGGSSKGMRVEKKIGEALAGRERGGLWANLGRNKRVGTRMNNQIFLFIKKIKCLELIRSREILTMLHKFKIKYGFEAFEIRNKFPFWNF